MQVKLAEEIVAKHLPSKSQLAAAKALRQNSYFLESVLRVPSLGLLNPEDHLQHLLQCMHSEAIMLHADSDPTHTPCLG